MEREKGVEPSTSTLARLRSTTELLPHGQLFIRGLTTPVSPYLVVGVEIVVLLEAQLDLPLVHECTNGNRLVQEVPAHDEAETEENDSCDHCVFLLPDRAKSVF